MAMPQSRSDRNRDPIRVYAPSRGSLALAAEAAPQTHVAEPYKKPVRTPAAAPKQPAVRKRRRTLAELFHDYKVFPKTFAVLAVGVATAALLLIMSRYNRISASYTELNELNDRASKLESAVEDARVKYLFSIDIGAAHDAAKAVGMVYPTIENIDD